jgi:hypothetical protein
MHTHTTGYVIVNAMLRIEAKASLTVTRCLKRFAMARPPGIYKDTYINDLFKWVSGLAYEFDVMMIWGPVECTSINDLPMPATFLAVLCDII